MATETVHRLGKWSHTQKAFEGQEELNVGINGVFVKPKLVVGTEAKLRQTDLTKDIQVQPKKKKKDTEQFHF